MVEMAQDVLADSDIGRVRRNKVNMAITLLCDLDGTLLPRPYSVVPADDPSSSKTTTAVVAHPSLSEGPAYEPLVRLLDLGATVVGITGSQLATHQRRFFDELPLRHRRDGRVILAVQTGSQLYVPHSEDGRPMRDEAFDAHLSESISVRLDDAIVAELTGIGRRGLVRFYSDLADDPGLVELDGPLGYLVDIAAKLHADKEVNGADVKFDVPVTDDVHVVPRIEIRTNNSAVVFVGVPSLLGSNYFDIPAHLQSSVDGRPTGRSCFDCVPAGLDKSHVVRYLIRTNVVKRGRTIALGDQPAGNDAGLTLWHNLPYDGRPDDDDDQRRHDHTIPFVAVSECHMMVPDNLKDWHVSNITNAEGSAKILTELECLVGTIEGDTGDITLCVDTVRDIVQKVNNNA